MKETKEIISKELASKALNQELFNFKDKEYMKRANNDENELVFCGEKDEIRKNIHELAHDTKAYIEDGNLYSVMSRTRTKNNGPKLPVAIVYLEEWTREGSFRLSEVKRFTAKTEPEAIFAAGEWYMREEARDAEEGLLD